MTSDSDVIGSHVLTQQGQKSHLITKDSLACVTVNWGGGESPGSGTWPSIHQRWVEETDEVVAVSVQPNPEELLQTRVIIYL